MKKGAIVLAALAAISAAVAGLVCFNISGAVDSVVSTDAEKCVAK